MNKRIRQLCGLVLALGIALPAVAAPSLVIKTKSGTRATFPLKSRPTVSFRDNYLNIESLAEMKQISVHAADVAKFYISNDDVETGIAEIRVGGGMISGLTPGGKVTIHTLAGVLVATVAADANGCVVLSIEKLESGTYVISTSSNSFKITK